MDGLDSRSPMARKVPRHPFFKFFQGSLHNNNNNNKEIHRMGKSIKEKLLEMVQVTVFFCLMKSEK